MPAVGREDRLSTEMIERVSLNIEIPLIVGGGIQDPEKVYLNAKAGADMIVVGNAIEKDAPFADGNGRRALHSVSVPF